MKRYRVEIGLLVFAVILFALGVRVFGEDPPKPAPAVTLKPGDEVKPLELESAKLGKLKAQISRNEAQENFLQAQYQALEGEKRQLQTSIDTLVKEIQARVKAESRVEVVYDQKTGEDGTFHVNRLPAADTPKK